MGCFGGGCLLVGLGAAGGCLLLLGAAGAVLRLPGPSERAAARLIFRHISRQEFQSLGILGSGEAAHLLPGLRHFRPLAKHSGRWRQ